MNEVHLRLDAFRPGELPEVCAKSGLPASGTVRTVAREPIGDTWRLLLLGIVPFFFVRAFRARQAQIDLPASAAVGERLHRLVYITRVTSLASVFVMIVGTLATHAAILMGGIATAVVSLGAAAASHVVWVDATLLDDVVVLQRVHPAFTRTIAMRGTRRARLPT